MKTAMKTGDENMIDPINASTEDRLASLALLPPATATPWTGWPLGTGVRELTRPDGTIVSIPSPLFWLDPPWHRLRTEAADIVATAVANLGVTVSALRRDLAIGDDQSTFHTAFSTDQATAQHAGDQCRLGSLPRIVPYRAERFGIRPADFDGAAVVDLRLALTRDPLGRFAYSAQQVKRWEATAPDHPLAGGSWVPAAMFPPDVESLGHLSSKIAQLRCLAPEAAVFVSISPYRLEDELPAVIATGPDGIILRCDDVRLPGLLLATMTRRARQLMGQSGLPEMPLWIAPGPISADDAVKLTQLGASAVAIDSWCQDIIEGVVQNPAHLPAEPSPFSTLSRVNEAQVQAIVSDQVADRVERFAGLQAAMLLVPDQERLVTTDPAWAEPLGLKHLTFGI